MKQKNFDFKTERKKQAVAIAIATFICISICALAFLLSMGVVSKTIKAPQGTNIIEVSDVAVTEEVQQNETFMGAAPVEDDTTVSENKTQGPAVATDEAVTTDKAEETDKAADTDKADDAIFTEGVVHKTNTFSK